MKKNSGSALVSVIVMFLLVTIIGVPLLSMVVYNYQLREYDSGIKEAEYKNEVVMDRISTIIKNSVITAISNAKNSSTQNITSITEALVNSYNSSYDDAYDMAVEEIAIYDNAGNITNMDDIEAKIREILTLSLQNNIPEVSDDGITKAEVVGILALDKADTDVNNAKINDERLQILCNKIFQKKYQDELLDENSGIFAAIYNDSEYEDLAEARVYGENELPKDISTGKSLAGSLKIAGKYELEGNVFKRTYDAENRYNGNYPIFNNDELKLGIESRYKKNDRVPPTELSATFIIGTPDFNMMSSIQQQTIALSNPTLDYGLIVGDTLTINGDVKVDGNILARANKNEDVKTGILLKPGATLKEEKMDSTISAGRIATSGDIVLDTNTTLVTGNNPIYYRNLYLGEPDNQKNTGSINVTFNGDVLAKDDLEINLNSIVKVTQNAGSYFGYNDENNEGPDSSSAIVVNSTKLNNLDISLNKLYLAGRAFIDGVRSTERKMKKVLNGNEVSEPMIYKTGESISIKGNYSAYQTPLIGTSDYDGDGITGDYDVNMVKFSPHFMNSSKEWLEGNTNLSISLVDTFSGKETDEDYSNFDIIHKWRYFREYYNKYPDLIKNPGIKINNTDIMYIEGAGITNNGLVSQKNGPEEKSVMISKKKKFEEFTSYFGYYPVDENKRKENITDWVDFSKIGDKFINGNFLVFKSSGDKSLSWGTTNSVDVKVTDEVKGIILHDGDLTITGEAGIPFNGLIIVTGNMTINGDTTIISNKDAMSEIIIQNYLDSDSYVAEGTGSGSLAAGDLFKIFTYDGSGTTYAVIDVTDKSNMIDINDLVGITDWKTQRYGRL